MSASQFRLWIANLILYVGTVSVLLWKVPGMPWWSWLLIIGALAILFPVIPAMVPDNTQVVVTKERKIDNVDARSNDRTGR
jgi:hypothetical protein